MESVFKDFYRLSDDEIKTLWDESIFVFDANILLNLYRYTIATRDEFLNILYRIEDRIWIPHQVGLEYHFNRLNVIQEQIDSYNSISSIIEQKSEEFIKELKINKKLNKYKKRHPRIDIKSLIEQFETNSKELISKIKTEERDHPNYMKDDKVLENITGLFTNKVGEPFEQTELDEIYKKGFKRYGQKIPPGFEDLDDKKGKKKFFNGIIFSDEYGDLVVWEQIIKMALEKNKSVIFITDDEKGDWWNIVHNRTLGPRIELINEFRTKTNNNYYMYKSYRFMEFAKEYYQNNINQQAIDEVKGVSDSYKSIYIKYPDWGFLTDNDMKIFNNMLYSSEEEGSSAAANIKYNKAVQWATSKNEERANEYYKKQVVNYISPYMSSITPVDRDHVYQELSKHKITNEQEEQRVTDFMVNLILGISAEHGY